MRNPIRILVAGLILAALSLTLSAQPLVLQHATVLDVTGGLARVNVSVVIEGGLITQISEQVTGPANATRVDATGKFLIPGLWDMHVHLSGLDRSFRLLLANGITGVREMNSGYAPRDYLPQRRNPLASRLVVSGMIDGPQMTPAPGRISVSTPEEARLAVQTLTAQGAEFIKVYSSIPREAYFALADECRRLGVVFAGHVPEAISPAEAAVAGQLSQEHLINVLLASSTDENSLRAQRIKLMTDGSLSASERARQMGLPDPVGLFDTYSGKKAKELFGTFADYGIWQTPTLVAFKTFAAPTEAVLRGPLFDGLSAKQARSWAERSGKLLERYKQLVRDMHDAGVAFLAGTDSDPSTGIALGESLHDELELLVQAGFTPAEALATATRNPAFYFGTLTLMGTVETGKVADIVILDANPLEDIRNTRKIAGVIQRGTYYSRQALDRLLSEVR